MTTDLEIARAAQMEPVEAVAWKLGISAHELTPMGNGVAKITWRALKDRFSKPQGSLVLVTSVNPTPFGEGKTVTTIGLTQALCRIGQSATCVVREPSMGPVFGIKGGAAGGGHAQVLPMEDINLHLTGDLHAVTSAHNLLSSLIDNHIKHGNEAKLDPTRISWPRVVDMNDRALRNIVVGMGGPANGNVREDRFDITAASEVMAKPATSVGPGRWRCCCAKPFYPTSPKRLKEILRSSTVVPSPTSLTETRASSPIAWRLPPLIW